jgi:chromosome segregation protein
MWSGGLRTPANCGEKACQPVIVALSNSTAILMHLQSLELFGFKSFADKTVFEFHEGVTAIVGPNGCGKSNVLDAVRWVLGEQSAKALRGGEMADVIFSGAETRKPVGFGEVSLTLTNCGSELGVDWHDVRVTRRVYRDGNSEYLLNKTPCRLRDIQSLFADTGVGRSAYSVMEQGKIDLILSSRPEDRRAVFEEAAGITRYKTQKREALRKLEATEANLLRIGDIIREVKRQIGSLQRQAGKARRYQALLADLQVLDTHHSHRQLTDLQAEAEQGRTEVTRLAEAEQTAHARIETSEDHLTTKRHDLDEIDGKIGDARARVQGLHSEIAALRNRIDFNQQRAQELGELIERYESDIAAAEAKRSEQETQIQEADALIARTNQLLKTKENEVDQVTEILQAARTERVQREEELESLHLSLSKFEARITTFQNDVTGVAARRDLTTARISELNSAVSNETIHVAEAKTKLTRAQAALVHEQRTTEQLRQTLRRTEEQQQQQQATLAQAEKEIGRIDRLIAEKQARLEVLRQMTEEGEGLEKGSQAVLKGLNDPDRIKPAIAGALVANLKVDREFIPALEAAFGRAMHAIVLNNSALAADIFQTLTDNKSGQAALAIPEWSTDLPATPPSNLPKGGLAWAIEKVDAPGTLASVVRRLLRDVVIVPDLATALRLKKRAGHLQYATLGGEFISADGIIFGGSISAASDSLLGRKVILDNLAQERDSLEAERQSLIDTRDRAQKQVEAAFGAVEEARRDHETSQQEHSRASLQVLAAERALQDAEQKLTSLHTEKNTLEQQVRIADERIAQLEADLGSQRKTFEAERERKSAAELARENARAQEEQAAEKLNELRLAVATERQRHESLVNHRQPMAAREAELSDLVAARRGDIATYQSRLTQQAKESRDAEAKILSQTSQLKAADDSVAALAKERGVRLAAVNEQESQARTLRDSLNHLRDLRGKEEVRQTQLQLRIENLVEHVMRRYQVDLRNFTTDAFAFQKTLTVVTKRRAKPEPAADEIGPNGVPATEDLETTTPVSENGGNLEQIIAALTRQLDNMGPVNLEAVHEYDELEERYRFLEKQNSDLVAARREVLDVIARINSTTQKLFAETFAQVRINFREMFGELFDGGRADLALVDENDPLNCGIEISARPPGKQSQSISLLSGGERTMTAVALLFAIYMVRPSPFCILDEMDAALDESNINRFIRVLERFVLQSQFIIITHNKRTIAKANILYGVTMEERGVSKLVGMKLAEDRGSDGELKRPRPPKTVTQRHFPLEGVEQEPSMAFSR